MGSAGALLLKIEGWKLTKCRRARVCTVAIGRKNYVFAAADSGGDRAPAMYSLICSGKLNGVDPEAYLRHVLARIADHYRRSNESNDKHGP